MNIQYMRRALRLAKKGEGYTNPNPLVGAVLVRNDRIIGEGYHEAYGANHAEINAMLHAAEDVRGADLYVTLEPCSHYGKTPPCAQAILNKGIKRVIVAAADPNPLVSGRGIALLRENGVEVITGVLEDESRRLNEIFFKYITTGIPFCILKTAMSLDGKIATRTGDSQWITGGSARRQVHLLRHRAACVMTGIGTVLSDDPLLTTRLPGKKGKDAVRVIVDSSARIPLDAKVLNLDSDAPTIIAVTEKAKDGKIKELEQKGAKIIVTPLTESGVDLVFLMKKLGEEGLDSVLLEGGSALNDSALRQGIVDKVNFFLAPVILGGDTAKTAVGGKGVDFLKNAFPMRNLRTKRIGGDVMIEGYVETGEERHVHRVN